MTAKKSESRSQSSEINFRLFDKDKSQSSLQSIQSVLILDFPRRRKRAFLVFCKNCVATDNVQNRRLRLELYYVGCLASNAKTIIANYGCLVVLRTRFNRLGNDEVFR